MTTRQMQWIIASVFLVLGGWALVWPRSVINLTLLPEYRAVLDAEGGRILAIATGCFGAQALISGLFAAFSIFTRTTFLAYGIALVAFFGFNIWFMLIDPIFTPLGWLDAIGNAVMILMCWFGWKRAA